MKILIAVPDTEVGGVNTAAINLSNELSSRGHTVYFLNMPGNNKCIDRLNENVNRVCFSGKSRLWNIGVESVRQARGLKKLGIIALGAIKKLTIRSGLWYKIIFSRFKDYGTFDVAVAFRQCAPCYSFVLNKVNAKRKMGFVHGDPSNLGDISSWNKFIKKFDKIAYVSNAVKKEFIKMDSGLEKNACTVYNMFNVEQIIQQSQESLAFEMDNSKTNIVTVSRITQQKQIDRILRVCQRIKNNCLYPFHWYIVGSGYMKEKMEALSLSLDIDDVVTFTGSMNNPFPLIRNSSFTVLASTKEAYGMVVAESLILQIPVVAAKYDALDEIISNGEYGLVCEQTDDHMYETVVKMIEDHEGIRTKLKDKLQTYTKTNDVAYGQFMDAAK